MFKRLLLIGTLAALLAAAKTYTFTISSAAQAGGAQLQPGQYSLKVDGAQAILVDQKGQRVETNASVESSDRKFNQTAVVSTNADGITRLSSIQLGGTTFKVVFQ